ncbi:MAG: RnfABCDGE type electron transport complex subunit B [Spirochaetaceae bacterium]|jgi:Na+-translocating ferredoxin:NAD+ oxidoreductase RNF subunit RnfB|nr:RnfABCDGE type electron transport complex subunit B [Spirochaetaceae bacterium]
MNTIVITAIFAASLALILGILLGIFRKVFHVETDVLVGLIRETLPGANCGACGFPGCDGFAGAVAAHEAEPTKCTVSDAENTKKRAALVGGSADVTPKVAVLACRGSCDHAKDKGIYTGEKNCRGAKISSNGTKACSWGCIGFGDCVSVCKFDAIKMGEGGIPIINWAKCTGCGMCIAECPQMLLKAVPRARKGTMAFCQNRNTRKPEVKKTCDWGCGKCGLCAKKCPEGAITMVNGIPEVDYAKCKSSGVCIEQCPNKVLLPLEIPA